MITKSRRGKKSPRSVSPGLPPLPLQAAGFDEIATQIAGGDAPAWLAPCLEEWAPSIAVAIGVETKQPTRLEMRKRLRTLYAAACLIRSELNDGATQGFLAERRGPLLFHGAMDRFLNEIAERATEAESTLSGPDGNTKPGRSRALPKAAFSPKVYCAAVIAEAWKHTRGEEPAPSNIHAARAAEMYWKTAGGTTSSFGNQPLNSWRHFFKGVREPSVLAWRKEIARHMTLSAQNTQFL